MSIVPAFESLHSSARLPPYLSAGRVCRGGQVRKKGEARRDDAREDGAAGRRKRGRTRRDKEGRSGTSNRALLSSFVVFFQRCSSSVWTRAFGGQSQARAGAQPGLHPSVPRPHRRTSLRPLLAKLVTEGRLLEVCWVTSAMPCSVNACLSARAERRPGSERAALARSGRRCPILLNFVVMEMENDEVLVDCCCGKCGALVLIGRRVVVLQPRGRADGRHHHPNKKPAPRATLTDPQAKRL